MKRTPALFALLTSLLVVLCAPAPAKAQDEDDAKPPSEAAAALVRQLTSRDPLERQRAAEELAELRAAEHLRLVEGYRMQEKNARVRVALDWALYRMGRSASLFDLVRALDTARADQAQVYLFRLDGPDPLYLFLERANGNTQIKLLNVLADLGDADTLEHIAPLARSADPKVADAARRAADEISKRAGQPAAAQTPQTPAEGSVPG